MEFSEGGRVMGWNGSSPNGRKYFGGFGAFVSMPAGMIASIPNRLFRKIFALCLKLLQADDIRLGLI